MQLGYGKVNERSFTGNTTAQWLSALEHSRTRLITLGLFLLVELAVGTIWITSSKELADVNVKLAAKLEERIQNENRLKLIKLDGVELEQAIRSQLATRDRLNGLLLFLEKTAGLQGVTLNDGNQIYQPATKTKLAHSTIQYSVQGSYPQVLQFVAQALNENPALTVKSLTFRRQDPMISSPSVSLEMNFYYE
ncbi:MAG: hypothetical protein ACK4FF_10410 [Limnobacter sp.]|uniref:hypothetical protein n=1 Tax=Limnobacter sp. TaxID=2003368 RepID=UPI00391A4B71